MAIIHPEGWRELKASGAAQREIETLALLAYGLPADYTVYHGVHWTRVAEGSFAIAGEIDFAIVGPTGKLLLVEQKSGFLAETPEGLVKRYMKKEKSVPIQMARSADALAARLRKVCGDEPVAVEALPDFALGAVSVQDPGAQRAAELLAPPAGCRVLDACAAPGGKTAHLLERSDIDLLALDLKAARCRRIEENLARLQLRAEVRVADCAKPAGWWDGRPFDAVLADVPCTASGVVRRNPDAKWLRREADIASFAAAQARILDALWQVVRPGGKLLYATCSVFPAENGEQIARFIERQPQARSCHEEQLLPTAEHDGFFYCLLEKHA